MRSRGVCTLFSLSDVITYTYITNSALALLPPTTLPPLLPFLSAYTDPPLSVRTLPTGVDVICTQEWTQEATSHRILSLLKAQEDQGNGGMSTFEISLQLDASSRANVGVGLIASMVEECESNGTIWRDDPYTSGIGEAQPAGGPKWWVNICTPDGYQWDGQD
jgi:ESCRT-II complex subunit VPS36